VARELRGSSSVWEDALVEATTGEGFCEFGNHGLELLLGQVSLHAIDEGAGDDDAGFVTGGLMLEREIAMVAPSAASLDEGDARVEAVKGAIAP
jgi:hypothetical protein